MYKLFFLYYLTEEYNPGEGQDWSRKPYSKLYQ